MIYNVKFAKGSSAGYTALPVKESDTIYFITDTGALYLGSTKISDMAQLTALETLVGTIPDSVKQDATTFAAWIQKVTQSVIDLDESLADVAKSGKAVDVTIDDAAGNLEATNVESAIAELVTKINGAGTAGAVTVVKSTEEGVAARYTFSQGGQVIPNAVIDIPKDMVIESGSVVTLAEEDNKGHVAGTYLKLVIANKTEDEIWIPVDTLIEYVTSGSQAGDMVFITVDSTTHKVTAEITDSSITKAKLDADVKASLGRADSAVQNVTVLGQVLENGDELTADQAKTALGLGSAAYQNVEAFDVAGAAQGVQKNLDTLSAYVGTASSEGKDATGLTKKVEVLEAAIGENGSVATQISNAINALDSTATQTGDPANGNLTVTVTQTDGKLTAVSASIASGTYDVAGSAATAETNAKAYTDTALTWGSF